MWVDESEDDDCKLALGNISPCWRDWLSSTRSVLWLQWERPARGCWCDSFPVTHKFTKHIKKKKKNVCGSKKTSLIAWR